MDGSLLFIAGVLMAGTFFAMMGRINMRRFLGYATWVDLFFTIVMFGLFAHTFSGVVAGSVAGLCMALGLTVMRKTMGYERVRLIRVRWYRYQFRWVPVAPVWTVRSVVEKLT